MGQLIDNPVLATSPQVNSYYYWPEDNSTNSAVPDVDYTATIANRGEAYNYRPLDLAVRTWLRISCARSMSIIVPLTITSDGGIPAPG